MGTYYELANFTRREVVGFSVISGMKREEIVLNPQGAVVAAWYMLKYPGDDIAFVPDDRPFRGNAAYKTDLRGFKDVTDDIVVELIQSGVLTDYGTRIVDRGDPATGERPIGRRMLRVRHYPPPDVEQMRESGELVLPPRPDGRPPMPEGW